MPQYIWKQDTSRESGRNLGSIKRSVFTIKPSEGVKAESFKEGDKFYIGPDKLLPLERFLPKPPSVGPKPKRKPVESLLVEAAVVGFPLEVVAVVDSPLEVVAVVDSHQEVVVAVSHQEVVVVEVPVETVEVDSEGKRRKILESNGLAIFLFVH